MGIFFKSSRKFIQSTFFNISVRTCFFSVTLFFSFTPWHEKYDNLSYTTVVIILKYYRNKANCFSFHCVVFFPAEINKNEVVILKRELQHRKWTAPENVLATRDSSVTSGYHVPPEAKRLYLN